MVKTLLIVALLTLAGCSTVRTYEHDGCRTVITQNQIPLVHAWTTVEKECP